MTSGATPSNEARAARAVELFTHPTCIGCQEALTALRALERAGTVALQVTSLGTPSGRERAEELGVTSVPTVRLGQDYRVLMRNSDLQKVVAEIDGSSA